MGPGNLIRRVTLTCPGQGAECSVELLTAITAVFAELNATPPNPDPSNEWLREVPGNLHRGPGVTAPVAIYRPEPAYSKEALKAHLQGTVTLSVVVAPDGRAHDIKVVRSLGLGLDEKAIEAVEKWEFRPGMKDGKPVNVRATIEVNFRLLKDRDGK